MLSTPHLSHESAHGGNVQHLDKRFNILEIDLPKERALRGQRMKACKVNIGRAIAKKEAVVIMLETQVLWRGLLGSRIIFKLGFFLVHSLHLVADFSELYMSDDAQDCRGDRTSSLSLTKKPLLTYRGVESPSWSTKRPSCLLIFEKSVLSDSLLTFSVAA